MKTSFTAVSLYQNPGGTYEVTVTNVWENPNDDDYNSDEKRAFQTTTYHDQGFQNSLTFYLFGVDQLYKSFEKYLPSKVYL